MNDQEKSFKYKLENFWYHYKIHTLVTLFLVVLLSSFIYQTLTKKDVALYVDIIGKNINISGLMKLNSDMNKELSLSEKEEAVIKFDNMESQTLEKISVLSAGGDIDVIVIEKNRFDAMVAQGFIKPLGDILSKEELSDLKLVEGSFNNEKNVFGIDVSENVKLKELQYDSENKIMAIISTSKKDENIKKFIKKINNIK